MELSVENLCGLLVRSKLLPADEVKALYQRWKGEARDGYAEVGPFSDWLAARGYVNKFQAALLTSYVRCAEKQSPQASVTERTPEPPAPEEVFDFGAVPLQSLGRKTQETPRPTMADVDTVDVELVENRTPPARPARPNPASRLSVRDWLMMGVGAGAVIMTAVAGMLVARWGG